MSMRGTPEDEQDIIDDNEEINLSYLSDHLIGSGQGPKERRTGRRTMGGDAGIGDRSGKEQRGGQ